MTARMDAVVLERVTKRYDALTAVGDLSLRIRRGALFGLLGPNGAGKTTTLRMLMRIRIPDEGSIQVLGEPLNERTQDRIGYLPESAAFILACRCENYWCFLAP